MAAPLQYRQGDVLLVAVPALPPMALPLAPEAGRVVLAHGEVTGHAHAMSPDRVCRFRDDGTGHAYLRVDGDAPSALSHEEHDTIAVAPGTYRVVQQREYEPQAQPRFVAD